MHQSLLNKHHISWSSLIAGYTCGQDMTYCPVVWHKRHKSVHLSWAALDVRPCLGATKKSQLRPSLDKWNNLAAGHKFKTSAYYTDKMGRQVQEDIYTTFLWRIFNNKSMKKKMSRYRIASQRWFIAPQMIYSTLIICLCWALIFSSISDIWRSRARELSRDNNVPEFESRERLQLQDKKSVFLTQ